MIVYREIEQNTEEWLKIRVGRITGSKFPLIMKKGRNSEWSQQALGYAYQIAAERIMRLNDDLIYNNKYTDYGHQEEAVAREKLEIELLTDIEQVGFIDKVTGKIGCSPDGLTEDSLIEIKCFQGKKFLKICNENKPIEDNVMQTIYNMWVTEKERGLLVYFNDYFPKPFKIFEFKKEEFTDEMINRVVKFNDLIEQIVKDYESK